MLPEPTRSRSAALSMRKRRYHSCTGMPYSARKDSLSTVGEVWHRRASSPMVRGLSTFWRMRVRAQRAISARVAGPRRVPTAWRRASQRQRRASTQRSLRAATPSPRAPTARSRKARETAEPAASVTGPAAVAVTSSARSTSKPASVAAAPGATASVLATSATPRKGPSCGRTRHFSPAPGATRERTSPQERGEPCGSATAWPHTQQTATRVPAGSARSACSSVPLSSASRTPGRSVVPRGACSTAVLSCRVMEFAPIARRSCR